MSSDLQVTHRPAHDCYPWKPKAVLGVFSACHAEAWSFEPKRAKLGKARLKGTLGHVSPEGGFHWASLLLYDLVFSPVLLQTISVHHMCLCDHGGSSMKFMARSHREELKDMACIAV